MSEPKYVSCRQLGEVMNISHDSVNRFLNRESYDGKANSHLLKFIADEFGVSKSACKLLNGESGRDKRVAITEPRTFPIELNISQHL